MQGSWGVSAKTVVKRVEVTDKGLPLVVSCNGGRVSRKNKVTNGARIVEGQVEETLGRVTRDSELEAVGQRTQMKGRLRQAVERVKDAFTK